eukprot:gene66-95_t
MCPDAESARAVCNESAYRFDEELLCQDVQFASGETRPFRFFYGDGHRSGMGGSLLLYVNGTFFSEASSDGDLSQAQEDASSDDRSTLVAYNAHSKEETNGSDSVEYDASSAGVESANAVLERYQETWNNTYDTLEEFRVSVYHVIKYDVANALHAVGDARFPAISEILSHGVRLYAESWRAMYEGVVHIGHRLVHGHRVSSEVLWDYANPVFEEYMATSASALDLVRFFLNPFQAYDQRSVRVLCEASRVPNHILSGSLKISSTISTAATFPVGADGESVGCNPLTMNCSYGYYVVETSLNLNPACAIAAVMENPSMRMSSDSLGSIYEIFGGSSVRMSTVSRADWSLYTGLEYVQFRVGSISVARYARTLVRFALDLMIDSVNCVIELDVQFASGETRPFRFFYGDGHRSGMGGSLLLYVNGTFFSEASSDGDLSQAQEDASSDDRSTLVAYNAHSKEETNGSDSVEYDASSAGVESANAVLERYQETWNNTYDTLEEFRVSVYHVIKYDVANALHAVGDARFPAISEILSHGVRLYAESWRAMYEGVVHIGHRLVHGHRVSSEVLWDYANPVFEEYMATSASALDLVRFFLNPFQAYDQRSVRVLCEASRVPNHILSGSLKISSTISTAATFPVGADGESVGCNPLTMNCSYGYYVVETSLNLNPACAIAAVMENPSMRMSSDSLGSIYEIFGGSSVRMSTVSRADWSLYTGLEYVQFRVGSISVARYARTLVRFALDLMIDSVNCVIELVGMIGESPDAQDCVSLLSDLTYPTFVVNTYVVITFEAQVHVANFFASFTSFVWSYLYVAANYDPSLYSTVSNWPRDASFAAMLPKTMCVGLSHSMCVQQGLGDVTTPGRNTFIRTNSEGDEIVVHACDRGLCHCAWVMTKEDFFDFRGEGANRTLYHRSHLTGDMMRTDPDEAERDGFAGFHNDTLRYYRQSARGHDITKRGYLTDAGAEDVLMSHDAPFPFWLFAPGACASACELTEDESQCGRSYDTYTPSSSSGVAPPFVRVGCTHSKRYGCSSDVHHIQQYPLEAATSTLLTAFMSGHQRAVMSVNLTVSYFYTRFFVITEETVSSDDFSAEDASRAVGELIGETSVKDLPKNLPDLRNNFQGVLPKKITEKRTDDESVIYTRNGATIGSLDRLKILSKYTTDEGDCVFLQVRLTAKDTIYTCNDLDDLCEDQLPNVCTTIDSCISCDREQSSPTTLSPVVPQRLVWIHNVEEDNYKSALMFKSNTRADLVDVRFNFYVMPCLVDTLKASADLTRAKKDVMGIVDLVRRLVMWKNPRSKGVCNASCYIDIKCENIMVYKNAHNNEELIFVDVDAYVKYGSVTPATYPPPSILSKNATEVPCTYFNMWWAMMVTLLEYYSQNPLLKIDVSQYGYDKERKMKAENLIEHAIIASEQHFKLRAYQTTALRTQWVSQEIRIEDLFQRNATADEFVQILDHTFNLLDKCIP